MAERALAGLRVVDISQGIAGPYATKLLADSGAQVTKVEPPGGDYTRRLGPFPGGVPDPEKSGLYIHLNTSKRGITLDVAVPSGRVVLKKLLAQADVFVTCEKTSVLREWGLAYDDLRGDFPDLVVAQITPFGGTGPYAGYEGTSLTAMAMSSLMYNTGEPDREPLSTGGEPGESIAGVQLWVGILAALANRDARGGGDLVDVSMAEAVAAADEYNAAMYAFQGAVRRRYYSRHIFGYPNDIVKAMDGYLVMIPGAGGFRSPLTPDSVSPMALLMEDPDLDENQYFTSGGDRMIDWRGFDALIEPYLSSHSAAEIIMTAQALRMPFAPVPDAADLLGDEHLAERDFFAALDTPAGEMRLPGAPFRMSGTPLAPSPAPGLGASNEQVLRHELGYEPDDMRALSDQGVI
jgi:crotonobetainyl-CoA:carnitine CoA-transferase CaiB-like acyl-CoA transferase